jgi:hypothetical protein
MCVSWRYAAILAVWTMTAGLVAAQDEPEAGAPADGNVIRDGFETERTTWQQEYTDTAVRLLAHERSERAAHGGRLSERFRFEAGEGSRFYVSDALPKVPVTEDLTVSLYVRSNREGAQVFGWVVLPDDIDPETRAPSFVLVPGTILSRPDRWEKLELADIQSGIEKQARILRATSRRAVPLRGAYLERVVVNLMGGAGETDVFLDDLQVGPVPSGVVTAWVTSQSPANRDREEAKGLARRTGAARENAEEALPPIRFSRGVFEKLASDRRYVPWFPTAVEAPGADPVALRLAGNDVLVTGPKPDPKERRAAVEPGNHKGMYLLPRLSGATDADGARRVLQEMAEYPAPQSVVLWSIGERLGRQRTRAARLQEVERVREVLAAMDGTDDGPRLATATVDGEFRLYTRAPSNLDVVGIDLPVWGTSQSFLDGLAYLNQRRDISARTNLEAMFWAWLPLVTPPEVVRNIWGTDEVPSWGTPPVQPEQLRLLTYMALAGGCRGLTYVGDADLTRPAGEPLLIEMSFLNAEIDLFEGILAGNIKRIGEYNVFDPDPAERPTVANVNQKRMPLVNELGGKAGLHAATIPLVGSKGALLLVADFNSDAQWQPPQMAYHDLVINPRLPQGVQFLEVSPGEARFLEQKPDDRVPGGTRLTLTDFGTTTMVLCTTDIALCERIQNNVQVIKPLAAQMAIRQAEILLASVREGHERLKADGHLLNTEDELKKRGNRGIDGPATDPQDLLAKAEEFIKNARTAQEAQDYSTAWGEARRALRPLRHMMHGYWNQGMAELRKAVEESINGKKVEYADGVTRPYPKPSIIVTAASCPPAISFYTLPQMHIWKDWIKGISGYRFGPNLIPSGSFDNPDAIVAKRWMDVSHQYEHIDQGPQKISFPRREKGPVSQPKEQKKTWATRNKKPPIRFAEDQVAETDHVLKLTVKLKDPDPKMIDEFEPYLDEPAAAVFSPPVRVAANNLIRISVLIRRPSPGPGGKGGIIVRDTIGGEQFGYRSSGVIPGYSRVVLYRRAPADTNLRVMLGLAGYGEAYFDDLRVEVVEEETPYRPVDPGLVQGGGPDRTAPRSPDPRTPAETASRATDTPHQR